jgi:uncharacterized Tic20 family protein
MTNQYQYNNAEFRPWGMEVNTFCMLMHLAQLAGFVPFGGIILPIVMWATNKDKSPDVDKHGQIIINWIISKFIYAVIGGLLIFVFGFGFIVLAALGICSLIFIILGAIKANNGELYPYPLSINFFK